jgi:hypothetical protein
MGAIIDIIGSCVLAGFVTLMGLRMNSNIINASSSYSADVVVQENLVSLVQCLEYDFRKMGYGISDPTTVILRADSNYISFRGDLNDNGSPDTVDWYLGESVNSTPNPNDRKLYRKYRSGGSTTLTGAAAGVTVFNLKYLNQETMPPISLGQIWIIETTVRLESPWTVQDRAVNDQDYALWGYSAAFWRQSRLASRNLKRHG